MAHICRREVSEESMLAWLVCSHAVRHNPTVVRDSCLTWTSIRTSGASHKRPTIAIRPQQLQPLQPHQAASSAELYLRMLVYDLHGPQGVNSARARRFRSFAIHTCDRDRHRECVKQRSMALRHRPKDSSCDQKSCWSLPTANANITCALHPNQNCTPSQPVTTYEIGKQAQSTCLVTVVHQDLLSHVVPIIHHPQWQNSIVCSRIHSAQGPRFPCKTAPSWWSECQASRVDRKCAVV